MRIGHGYDFHRYAPERKLVLGGVTIPHHVGLLGHSDADVIIHAVCDAILGALALGDIGQHFPDTDMQYKNCDSRELLKKVVQLMQSHKYTINNVDISVIADHPKIAPHMLQMRQQLANCLQVELNAVGMKATTQEGCAPEGICAHVVALLVTHD